MLKRRASKRFVLAEGGQDDVVWDSSVDSNGNITPNGSQNMLNTPTTALGNSLSVPKADMTQGLK